MSESAAGFEGIAPRPLSPTAAVGSAFQALRANLGASLGVGLFAVGFQFVGLIPWIGWIVSLFATPAATAGCYRYALERIRGRQPLFEVTLNGFKRWWPVVATLGLSVAIPMLAAAPVLGIAGAMGYLQVLSGSDPDASQLSLGLLPALVVATIVCMPVAMWLGYRLALAPFVIMEDGSDGPMAAVKQSWELTRGSWWRMFALQLLLALVGIAGLLVCGVGLLAAIPMIYYALAHGYEQLRRRAGIPTDFAG